MLNHADTNLVFCSKNTKYRKKCRKLIPNRSTPIPTSSLVSTRHRTKVWQIDTCSALSTLSSPLAQGAGAPEPVAVAAVAVTRDASVETFMDQEENKLVERTEDAQEDQGEEERQEDQREERQED